VQGIQHLAKGDVSVSRLSRVALLPLALLCMFTIGAGTKHLKIPPRSSRANTYAERFVLTARPEVADRMLIFGQRRLRAVLAGYGAHYNGRRPHGGLLNEYERAA
jgi:hypothetical protein